jgi:hypothetical protein
VANKQGEEGKQGNMQEIVQDEAARPLGSIWELRMNMVMAVSSFSPCSYYEQGLRTLIFSPAYGVHKVDLSYHVSGMLFVSVAGFICPETPVRTNN